MQRQVGGGSPRSGGGPELPGRWRRPGRGRTRPGHRPVPEVSEQHVEAADALFTRTGSPGCRGCCRRAGWTGPRSRRSCTPPTGLDLVVAHAVERIVLGDTPDDATSTRCRRAGRPGAAGPGPAADHEDDAAAAAGRDRGSDRRDRRGGRRPARQAGPRRAAGPLPGHRRRHRHPHRRRHRRGRGRGLERAHGRREGRPRRRRPALPGSAARRHPRRPRHRQPVGAAAARRHPATSPTPRGRQRRSATSATSTPPATPTTSPGHAAPPPTRAHDRVATVRPADDQSAMQAPTRRPRRGRPRSRQSTPDACGAGVAGPRLRAVAGQARAGAPEQR